MNPQDGLEARIEEFCRAVDRMDSELKKIMSSISESQFVRKPWPSSKSEYISVIREYCRREQKELPKNFYRKNLKQLKGIYYGIFKEDGKKRYYYRNFLNEYENNLTAILNSEGLKELVADKNYDEILKKLIGRQAYGNLEEKKAEEYSSIIREACNKRDKDIPLEYYTVPTFELKKRYDSALGLKYLMRPEQKLF